MTLKKIDRLKGLDLRSNPISQPDDKATIAENVHLDSNGVLRKRFGFDVHSTLAGCLQLIDNYNEVTKEEELLAVTSTGLHRYNEGTTSWDSIPNLFTRSITIPNKLNHVSHRGVLYLTNGLFDDTIPDFGVLDLGEALPLLKYDGKNLYQAGMPKPIFNSVPTGSGVYLLHIYELRDALGTLVQSDFSRLRVDSSVNQNYQAAAFTDYKLTRLLADKTYLPTSLNGQLLTLRVYISSNPNFGFKQIETIGITDLTAPTNINLTVAEMAGVLIDGVDLSEIYDKTYLKRLPPYCRQLTSYGDLLTLGYTYPTEDSGFDGINNISDFSPNEVRWSDLSTGGSPESYPALNSANLGTSNSGVSGLFGDSDSLVAFKNRAVFNISGNLFNGNYQVRDSLSDDIGCVGSQSIYKVEGGGIFLTERGFYWTTDGLKPTEFSDRLEPLFTKDLTGLDLTKCEAAADYINERLLFFIPATDSADSIVVVYDYYHKEWFTYKGFNAVGGFEVHKRELYHSDGTNIYIRSSEYNDDGTAIAGKYATSWQTEQYPSIDKKYTDLHVLNTSFEDYTLNVTPQYDWKEDDEEDSQIELTVLGTSVDTGIPLEPVNTKALRIILENSEVNEPLDINAIRYVVQKSQEEPKGDE